MKHIWKACTFFALMLSLNCLVFANNIYEMQQKIISRSRDSGHCDPCRCAVAESDVGEYTTNAQTQETNKQLTPAGTNSATSTPEQTTAYRMDTRKKLLSEVEKNWNHSIADKFPISSVNAESIESAPDDISDENINHSYQNFLLERVSRIIIPQITFINTPLSRVVAALGTLAEKHDTDTASQNSENKGINFVLLTAQTETNDPAVNLNLKNISLLRLIDYVAQSSGMRFDITQDAVIFYKPDMTNDIVDTQFFPISRATLIKLTGTQDINNKMSQSATQTSTISNDERAIKEFFQRAGVNFHDVPGSNLAFDGSQIIVTNTARNLYKISNILKKYSKVKQVEIEIKFLEVQQGLLDELGFRWQFGNRANTKTFLATGTDAAGKSSDNLRTLAGAFSSINFSRGDGKIVVNNVPPTTTVVSNQPPGIPGQLNLGIASTPISNFTGVLDSLQCNMMIQALEQHTGSDLMSAPKLTVMSGKTAEIIIAMELRYPLNYGDIRSEVGSGTAMIGNNSSAGVTITAGTPKDFTMRNVGVEMRVTPTVEEDDSISLQLEPKVTEFEGFVEYGGMSVAVTSGSTVSIPSGFYQPIFSTREIRTEVNIADGTTVVMGGLTREEVKEVHDQVPILGKIPLLGKLFRSKSETTQKRNLLIFVTAHTISPLGQKNVAR